LKILTRNESAGSGELWLRAGLWAGAAVGALDVVWAAVRGVGGLSAAKALRLLVLGAGWMALAGLAAGAAIAGGGWLAERLSGGGGGAGTGRTGGGEQAASRRRSAVGMALAALAAAPVLVYDAVAAFSGRRAAEIPGHRVISVVLALVGTAAVVVLARAVSGLVAAGAGRRGGARAGAVVLAAMAAAAEVANQLVLPRLYPWFHATLAGVTLLAALLAARLFGVHHAGATQARLRPVVLGVGLVAVAVAGGFFARGSQTVRFAAFERTAALAQLLRLAPAALGPQTYAAREQSQSDSERHLPPLPEGPRLPDADIVLITVDALRADHVGAYGYTRRPTTPNIDALAARGVRFVRAYAQAPHTSFSAASMLTGKYFPTLARLAPAEVHDPVASVLKRYGWKTGGFYPPAVFFVDSHKLRAYAESNFSFEYVKFEYMDARPRVDQVIRFFEVEKPRRAFVWVHFFEPHEPYLAHPEFPFGTGDLDRYDSEIAYVDAAIGRLVAYVGAHRPRAAIMVTADHGEEFDEHGGRYHGSTLFDEQVRVPLVMVVPGVSPRVVEPPVELIDIAPTVLNLLDLPVPARMRGTDLGPWLATPPADPARLPPAFAEVEDKRMIVVGTEKLICDLNWGFCAYHDLSADPREQRNLADERPERAAALRQMLDHWLDGHVRLEPVLARGASNPNGEQVPRPIERGRLGDLLAGPELAALMLSTAAPAPVRREAAELLVTLPPRKETAAQLALAADDRDPGVADWAAVGALRGGDERAAARVRRVVADPALAPMLRVRGAMALANRGDGAGVPVLGEALGRCEGEVLLCRLIILQLGKLKDRRAVGPLLRHLPDVQNRREMVDALGDIGDPAAIPALLERLERDEYVPVRAQAARALAKIGRADVLPALERAARTDTEASVAEAAREAIAKLKAGRAG
jgi:HEAT repeat protein